MIKGSKGIPISYECSELIAELKQDIVEFGRNEKFAVWLRNYPEYGVEIAVNYDFIMDEKLIGKEELKNNERLLVMSAGTLLDLLKKQNDIINVYEI